MAAAEALQEALVAVKAVKAVKAERVVRMEARGEMEERVVGVAAMEAEDSECGECVYEDCGNAGCARGGCARARRLCPATGDHLREWACGRPRHPPPLRRAPARQRTPSSLELRGLLQCGSKTPSALVGFHSNFQNSLVIELRGLYHTKTCVLESPIASTRHIR